MTVAQTKEAVRGYLALSMPEEALKELATLPEKVQVSQEVLELSLAAQMMKEDWKESSSTAMLLCKIDPKSTRYFIHAAYCLHEMGDTEKAKVMLLTGPKELMDEPLFHYNMACYLAILDQPKNAKHYLEKSFELDATLKKTASEDADLQSLDW